MSNFTQVSDEEWDQKVHEVMIILPSSFGGTGV